MFFRRLKKFDKGKEEKLRKDIEEAGGLEKNDLSAMIFSALLTILPVCILILLGISLIALLAFGAI